MRISARLQFTPNSFSGDFNEFTASVKHTNNYIFDKTVEERLPSEKVEAISVENHIFFPSRVFNASAEGFPCNWVSALGGQKTRVMGLPGGERSLTISSADWIQFTNVTDGRTDRETDRHRATAKTRQLTRANEEHGISGGVSYGQPCGGQVVFRVVDRDAV